MARCRSQHGRPLILGRYDGRQTDITPADFRRFKRELMSRPDRVLLLFSKCEGLTLMDLPTFLEILVENRARALVIARVAAGMKIAIGDEEIDDILATMKPGEV